MALKAFLNQKTSQSPVSDKNADNGARRGATPGTGTNTLPQARPATQVQSPSSTTPTVPTRAVSITARENDSQADQIPAVQQQLEANLKATDRDTLKALSALQIRYGHAGEAVPYLLMIRKTNPEDMEAARLLSIALMKLKRWEEAEMVLAEINAAPEKRGIFSFLALHRSIVAFKVRKFSEASAWLARFRNLKRGEKS